MYRQLGCDCNQSLGACPDPSLGVVTAVPQAVTAAVSLVGSLLSAIDFIIYPMDRQRRDAADYLYNRAAGGDKVAEAQLRLLSHVGTQADIATMKAAGIDPQCIGDVPGGCGWATEWAQRYGQARLAELAARRAAGYWGAVAIGQSTLPNQISSLLSNPVVLMAGVGLILLTMRRRR